jgi:hypothetical protein
MFDPYSFKRLVSYDGICDYGVIQELSKYSPNLETDRRSDASHELDRKS